MSKMNLAMLGGSYSYQIPTYTKANGRGYISGIGSSLGYIDPATGQEFEGPPTREQYEAQWGSKSEAEKKETARRMLEQGTEAATAFFKMIQSFSPSEREKARAAALAAEAQRGSGGEAVDKFDWTDYTPWLIGGGVALLGLLMIAGTRKRRRR